MPSSTLVPSRRTTSGTLRPTSLTAATTPSAMTSQRMMPPKMLTRMPFDRRVGGDDLEGRRDLLLDGAAADVEEVRRLRAVELDDVHGRHGEAGAVDHAADVAVERDIGEVVLRRLDLLRRLLRVASRSATTSGWRNSALSSKRHLGVEHAQAAVLHDDQRVDLEQAHVLARRRPCRASGTALRRPSRASPSSFSAASRLRDVVRR